MKQSGFASKLIILWVISLIISFYIGFFYANSKYWGKPVIETAPTQEEIDTGKTLPTPPANPKE